MIRLPFLRKVGVWPSERPSDAFAAWCEQELERRRDAGEGFDEAAFRAAAALAIARLRATEREAKA